MSTLVDEIYQCLQTELELYRQLLELTRTERDILVSGDHQELMSASQAKLELCKVLVQRQDERRDLMASLSGGAGNEPMRLGDLMAFLPASRQPAFKEIHNRLKTLAHRLGNLNQQSKGFIEEALDTVEHLLGILTNRGQSTSYSAQGITTAPVGARLVTREV